MTTAYDSFVSQEMPANLPALLELDVAQLAELYRAADVPRLHDLTGDLKGRMLAVAPLDGALSPLSRVLAKLSELPWRGKSFSPPQSSDRGEGVNRVISDRWKLFR